MLHVFHKILLEMSIALDLTDADKYTQRQYIFNTMKAEHLFCHKVAPKLFSIRVPN